MTKRYQLAVNGTLMRGFPLNGNLIAAGARFLYESKTTDEYRLWSINDSYPGMLKISPPSRGKRISLEVWDLDASGLLAVLEGEPEGLTIGRVNLQQGSSVFGVLAEPWIVNGQREITELGGWREYVNSLGGQPKS